MADNDSQPNHSNPASNESTRLNDMRNYVWEWFKYHAGQRMIAFNFFLIIMGALSLGYFTAIQYGFHLYATVVGLFGSLTAIAFSRLDKRNVDLVNIGRKALEDLEEKDSDYSLVSEKCKLLTCDKEQKSKNTHKRWFFILQLVLFILFLGAAIVSLHQGPIKKTKEFIDKNQFSSGEVSQMPYIKQERRNALAASEEPQNAGELNYAITMIVDRYLQSKGGIRYAHLNEVIGAMDCAKMELYRRLAVPYEDQKIKESGDVYRSDKK